MPNTFYSSFTTTELSSEDEEYFWQNFAGSDGFRLTFEVVAGNCNFRKMYYEKVDGEPIKLLSKETLENRVTSRDIGPVLTIQH